MIEIKKKKKHVKKMRCTKFLNYKKKNIFLKKKCTGKKEGFFCEITKLHSFLKMTETITFEDLNIFQ